MAKNEAKVRFVAETAAFNAGIKGINTNLTGLRAKLKLNKVQMDGAGKSTDALKERQKLLEAALKESSDKTDLMSQKMEKAAEIYGENADETKRLQTAVTNAKIEEENLKNQLKQVTDEILDQGNKLSALSDGFQAAGEKISEAGKKVSGFGKKVSDVGGKVSDVGGKITAGVTTPIVAAGVGMAKMGMDVEDTMAKVSTIADETQVPISDLKDSLMDLSNDTGITFGKLGEDTYNAISGGVSTANAVAFAGKSAKLSKAGFTESADALDILTTTMNAYGMAEEEVDRISDVLITTQNLGKTTVGELSSTMGKVIPTANGVGVGLESLAAMYAVSTANGIKTAESTTYINAMLGELGKSGSGVAKILKSETGKSFQELMEDGYSITDVLSIIDQKAQEDGKTFKDMWSSAQGGSVAQVFLSHGDQYTEALDGMNNSAGATDEAFEKMQTTSAKVGISINRVKNSLAEFGGSILETVAPAIDKFGGFIENVTEKFNGLDQEQRNGIMMIAAVVAGIGPVILIVGKVISLIGFGITVIGGVISAIGTVISVIGTIIGFIGTVIGVITGVISAVTGAIGVVGTIGVAIVGLIGIIALLKKPVEIAVKAITGGFDKAKGAVQGFKDFFNNLKLQLPKFKLPHFSIQGSFSLDPPSIPHIGVDWYAKGGVLNEPTIFGKMGNRLLGGGEAGPEAVSPISVLQDYIADAVGAEFSRSIGALEDAINSRPLIFDINGRAFMRATATDGDAVNGNRQNLALRGLTL